MYCWLPMTRRRPPPQSWARPGQDGERRINVILNHKATVLFTKRHNVTERGTGLGLANTRSHHHSFEFVCPNNNSTQRSKHISSRL
jgi:hypothetical protein